MKLFAKKSKSLWSKPKKKMSDLDYANHLLGDSKSGRTAIDEPLYNIIESAFKYYRMLAGSMSSDKSKQAVRKREVYHNTADALNEFLSSVKPASR